MTQLRLWRATVVLIAFQFFTYSVQLFSQEPTIPSGICDAETTLLARIDADLVDILLGAVPEEEGAQETVLENRLRQTKEILGGEPVWITLNWPTAPTKISLSISDPDGTRVRRLLKLWNYRNGRLLSNRNCKVTLKSVEEAKNETDNELTKSWNTLLSKSPDGQIIFCVQPPKRFYSTLEELTTELPDYLGGGPVTLLTEGALSASVSIDPTDLSTNGFVQSKDSEAARRLTERFPNMLDTVINNLSKEVDSSLAVAIQRFAKGISFSAEEDRVRISHKFKYAVTAKKITQQAVDALIGTAGYQTRLEKLRSAALGILNYESAHRSFPPPAESREAKTSKGLSWRVHILPFIGEYELWQEFKMDEPWDSPANKKLLSKMPDVYSSFPSKLLMPTDAATGMTTMVAPVSDNTILGAPHAVTFNNIIDGSSNTVLLVTVKDSLAVPWTAPRDYKFDPDEPDAGLQFDRNKTPIVMCDGSTHSADRDNPWQNLFEMNDKTPVQLK